jgi:hypothetical protein
MKKQLYCLTILLITLISCSKDNIPVSPYIGEYKGTIITSGFHAAGTYDVDTLKDYNIIVTASSYTPGHVFLHNGIIDTREGEITGNNFTIERRLAGNDAFFEAYEWAEGTFSGAANITWIVTFYRETVYNGNVIARVSRNCVLVKQ